MTVEQPAPRRRLLTAFRGGLLSGLATCAFFALALTAWSIWVEPLPPYVVEVLVNGGDVSRLEGKRIVVENNSVGVLIAATCNGGCDDLGYRLRTVEDEDVRYRVKVLDAVGACVACGEFEYVQPVFGPPGLSRWMIAGRKRLDVQPSRYDFRKDGTVKFVKAAERPRLAEPAREPSPKN